MTPLSKLKLGNGRNLGDIIGNAASGLSPRSKIIAAMKAGTHKFGASAGSVQAKPSTVRVPPPAGYRPGIDPEHVYRQPTGMAKGGKVTRGDGCCMKGKTKGAKR